ncbi:MAG TPA: reverse transcriptase family protein, partial [Ktedonobacterales bacterium]|nr:reverse transcriptase family protein [Ktedonobacterales bacterium]
YSFTVAATLALLCTEHEREPFDRDGTRYHISIGPRYLVQGAPTSPALANLVAWRLDRRLAGLAAKHQLTYTRYADDLTFSGDDPVALKQLHRVLQRIIRDERFTVNPAKTRVAGRAARQIVTGLVVNDIVAVPRAQRRRLRAILHNAGASGLAAQNRDSRPAFRAYLQGLIAHIHAANPAHAAPLRASLARVVEEKQP